VSWDQQVLRSDRIAAPVAEQDGPAMFARIGVMRALHRHEPKPAQAPRRKRAKVYKVVRSSSDRLAQSAASVRLGAWTLRPAPSRPSF